LQSIGDGGHSFGKRPFGVGAAKSFFEGSDDGFGQGYVAPLTVACARGGANCTSK
jgi:hypothetical protein